MVMDGVPMVDARGGTDAANAAFCRYVVPELPALLRAARALTRNHHDAEDLVQDTVVRAFRAMEGFDGRLPRAWLFTILRNTHRNRNRRRRPENLDDPHDSELVVEPRPSDPAELAERDAFGDVVLAAVAALPEKMRLVMTLVDVEHCTYAEASVVLGLPIGTVMSRLHRARQRVKAQLVASGWSTMGEGTR